MSKILVKQGFNTVGHIYDSDDTLDGAVTSDIRRVFTVSGGNWFQWDADEADFADFDTLEKGKGYLVESLEDTELTVSSSDEITSFDIPISTGTLDMIAIPKEQEVGKTERFNTVKAFDVSDSNWGQWDAEEADFADFETFLKGKGYLVEVDEVYESQGSDVDSEGDSVEDGESSENDSIAPDVESEPDLPPPELSTKSAGVLPICLALGVPAEYMGFSELNSLPKGVRLALYNLKN